MCSPLTNKTMPLEDPQFVKLSLLDSAESLSVPAVPVFKTHHDIAQPLSAWRRTGAPISLGLNDLDTTPSQRLDELLGSLGVGDETVNLLDGADTRDTAPAEFAEIGHHGGLLGYRH